MFSSRLDKAGTVSYVQIKEALRTRVGEGKEENELTNWMEWDEKNPEAEGNF